MSKRPPFDVDVFLARYDEMDARLVNQGWHPTSPWWRARIERFLRGDRRQWVARVGRRGGKGATLCRFAVAWALFGPSQIQPGDTGVVSFVSHSRDEAKQRLRTIDAILTAFDVPHRRVGESIELDSLPVAFKVFTASIAGVSGHTSILCIGDEVTKWRDSDTGANPAKEVLASLRPTLATMPHGKMLLVSSALTNGDAHALAFEQGDTAFQLVDAAQTWEANPSLSEADCRALEPDPKIFLREYGNVPSDTVENDFFGSALDVLQIARTSLPLFDARYFIAIDQAFQRDRFGYAVASCQVGEWDHERKERKHKRVTVIHEVGAWKPDRSPREMARRLRNEVCERYQTTNVVADQYGGVPFAELAKDVGVRLRIVPWVGGDGETSKATRYRSVRLAMHQGAFRLPDDPSLMHELRSVRSIITSAGNERIEVPRTSQGHGDRVSALVLAATEAMEGPVHLDPSIETIWEKRARRERERAFQRLCDSMH